MVSNTQSPLAANQAIVNPDGTPTQAFMRWWIQQGTINGTAPNDFDIVFTDIVANNASTTKHGFLPKLNGSVATFLNGTGAFAVPPGGGGSSSPLLRWLA